MHRSTENVSGYNIRNIPQILISEQKYVNMYIYIYILNNE